MRLLAAGLLLLLTGCSPPSQPPAGDVPAAAPAPPLPAPVASEPPEMPYEDYGACPFEGCTYRIWTARERMNALTERRDDAPVAYTLAPGERVSAITGVVVVTRPGRVNFTEPTAIDINGEPVTMQRGETVYLLTPIGEGHFVASVRGRIYRDVDGNRGELVQPVEYQWWVQMRNIQGRLGWVRVNGQFDGTDARG